MLVAVLIGTTLTLLGLTRPAATVCALVRVDEDRDVNPVEAYRLALTRARAFLGASGILAAAWITLTATVIGIPPSGSVFDGRSPRRSSRSTGVARSTPCGGESSCEAGG